VETECTTANRELDVESDNFQGFRVRTKLDFFGFTEALGISLLT